MAVFGAEQVQESNKLSRYFEKCVIAVNIGGIFATLLVPYIQFAQTDPNRFFYGYLLAEVLLIGAILLFTIGHRFYIHIKPHDTIITELIPVLINAFQTWRQCKLEKDIKSSVQGSSSFENPLDESINNRDEQLAVLNRNSPSIMDFARASNGGKFTDRIVDDVMSLRRVIVVFFLLIPYWLVYYQVNSILCSCPNLKYVT